MWECIDYKYLIPLLPECTGMSTMMEPKITEKHCALGKPTEVAIALGGIQALLMQPLHPYQRI